MIPILALPALNAVLNGASALILASGFLLIRRNKVTAHKYCMLSAFGLSTLFLISYVTYHLHAGATPFAGQGWTRPVYFSVLISHIVLAAGIVPLSLTVLYRGLHGRYGIHRQLARWVLPAWLYVCVTGVMIYFTLYHLFPSVSTMASR
ncbi:MAG: DUF420 domain-containing protein [Chloroflexi bacterium]|nr:DUF420 domain-containing protein [Chloroflexota bacterium]